MPFALVTIGILLVITGFQNTYAQLGSQISKDFTGPGNFTYWVLALGIVGALGYNDTLKPFSRAFMALIIVGIFLSNNGFFAKLNPAIVSGTNTKPLPAGGIMAASAGGALAPADGFGSDVAGFIDNAKHVAEIAATIAGFL